MRQKRITAIALLATVGLATPTRAWAQLVNSSGTWSNMTTPTNGGATFWDNASGDGAACNVGYYLLYTSGNGYGPCSNQQPSNAYVEGNAGRLGVSGSGAPNGSYLSQGDYSFAPGAYTFRFLGNIASFGPPNQQLGVFTNPGSPTLFATLYPGASTQSLSLNQTWFLGAFHASGGADYTNGTGPNHGWALFSSRAANASPGGLGDTMWAAFGDVKAGDQDYNDLVVEITSVPEPGSIALMGVGLSALALVVRRRRRV